MAAARVGSRPLNGNVRVIGEQKDVEAFVLSLGGQERRCQRILRAKCGKPKSHSCLSWSFLPARYHRHTDRQSGYACVLAPGRPTGVEISIAGTWYCHSARCSRRRKRHPDSSLTHSSLYRSPRTTTVPASSFVR